MRDDSGSPRLGAGTLAVIGLATCCGVKLAILASAGVVTAGAVGRSVAVVGLGGLVLAAALLVRARRRTEAQTACRRGTDAATEATPVSSGSPRDVDPAVNEHVADPVTDPPGDVPAGAESSTHGSNH